MKWSAGLSLVVGTADLVSSVVYFEEWSQGIRDHHVKMRLTSQGKQKQRLLVEMLSVFMTINLL